MLSFVTWTASPNLFDGFVTVRWYGLMFAIGFLIGYEIVYRIFKHEGAPEKWLGSLFIYVVVATILGARLGHVFFYDWAYYSQHPGEILKVWEGGLASHGGTAGILIAIWIFSRLVTKRPMLWTLDRLVVPVGLVAALIRIGNLMNHEIYGGETTLPWGFQFVDNIHQWMQGAEPIFTAPSHPTQIYEALCYLITFGVCMYMYWKRNAQEREGLIFGVFMLGIFVPRFLIEFIKNVQEPWEIAMRQNIGLDQGQLLSIPFIVLGIWLIIRAMRRPRVALEYPNEFSDAEKKKKK
ncbi:MAG: prolipoprotein diacylglyceryl transferase [Muribaculaceae bacterium]|nr:prolipoprotein diacylglyceryl transferase [Muribaculaceae bacterium]